MSVPPRITDTDIILSEITSRFAVLSGLRVKHLDRSSIESLGWKHCFNENWHRYEIKRGGAGNTDGKLTDSIHSYVLEITESNVTIFFLTEEGRIRHTLFQGTIRNKSELAQVMKMVGITQQ